MTRYDRDDEPPRRPSIMEERLRRSRGEPVDDFDDVDDSPPLRHRPDLYYDSRGGGGGGGGGCAQAVLYLMLGAVAVVVILLFAGDRLLGRMGDFLNPRGRVGELLATPTTVIVDRGATIRQIQAISRLETTRYSVETVIPVSKDSTFLGVPLPSMLGGDSLLLVAKGKVVAGVDLGKLKEQDVQLSADGKQIRIKLPPSEIFDATLDEQGTQVFDRDRGLIAPENKDLETEARRAAQTRILQAACQDGVMQQAAEQSQSSVEKLLKLSGFSEVVVEPQAGTCPYSTQPEAAPVATTTP